MGNLVSCTGQIFSTLQPSTIQTCGADYINKKGWDYNEEMRRFEKPINQPGVVCLDYKEKGEGNMPLNKDLLFNDFIVATDQGQALIKSDLQTKLKELKVDIDDTFTYVHSVATLFEEPTVKIEEG